MSIDKIRNDRFLQKKKKKDREKVVCFINFYLLKFLHSRKIWFAVSVEKSTNQIQECRKRIRQEDVIRT